MLMRRLGSFLMAAGVVIGGAVGLGMLVGLKITALPWLLAVGLGKLVFFSGVGLIGAGATLRRIAKRRDERLRLPTNPE
jgi:hypothetical protein